MELKWGKELCTEGYVPMPKKLLRSAAEIFDGDNSLTDLIVTLAIADTVTKREAPISYAFLSFIAGIEEDLVRSSVDRLHKLGYINIEEAEKFRFHFRVTGLIDKVDELNEKSDSEYTAHNQDFPPTKGKGESV